MDDHGPVLPPCYLYNFSLAHSVNLGHDVEFTQTTPTHLFAGRAVQFVLVLALHCPHASEPILQRPSRPPAQCSKHAATAIMAANDNMLYFKTFYGILQDGLNIGVQRAARDWRYYLRWTKSSPGPKPTISLAGTRLSAQPIQRNSGVCVRLRRSKYCGSSSLILSAQTRLFSKSFGKNFITALPEFGPAEASRSSTSIQSKG